GHTNRIGIVSGTSFTDIGALAAPGEQYYFVTAENTSGIESGHASNMAMRRRVVIDPGAAPSRTAWIALPYVQPSISASALVTAMNGGLGTSPVTRVAVVDRSTQLRKEWSAASGTWSGNDFGVLPQQALEVTVSRPLQWNLLGAEASHPAYGFAFHANVGNLSWVSLPQNSVYTDARSLVQALNGGPGGAPVSKVAWLDPATGQLQSWLYFAGAWRGNNFTLAV